ncbi:MAG: flagellar protein FlaG [Campylobacterales bacterium]|nr:flagellar protein FlaG [Campylobacterales bacterium]
MELMQNVAKMQNSQMNAPAASSSNQMQQHRVEAIQQAEINQQKKDDQNSPHKVDSQKDVEDLVKELNRAIDPFNTSLRFGFDNRSEDFYVSVIESESNRMIRRFPAEKAAEFLSKIQELNGFLFDEMG